MVAAVFDQYTTVQDMFRVMPTWISGFDQRRIASYNTYEQIYWNVPEAFKVVHRGSDTKPIYVPSGKVVIETLHRFLANDLNVIVDPGFGTEPEQKAAGATIADLFRRERFYSKFTANKRYGIIRGDWMFHLYADPRKPEGSRISIFTVDPASYFPIHAEDNLDIIVGCHLVEPYTDESGKERIRRLTYRKADETAALIGGPSPITVEEKIFEVDAWGGPDMDEKTVEVIIEEQLLPAPIDSLPVYHIQNFAEPGSPWGSSELRGMERLISAINQGISDEELALALEGLGVYVTDSGAPIDEETGLEDDWNLGPGRVVEVAEGKDFKRVQGVSSVAAMQDHLKYLHEQLDLGTGTPAIAKGEVDVQVAESGVALALRMGPLLSSVKEKEQIVTDVIVNFLFDLRKWILAYEGPVQRAGMENVRFLPTYGEKIPQNRKQKFDELMTLFRDGAISHAYLMRELSKLGYDIPDPSLMYNQILEEKTAMGMVEEDAIGSRMDRDLEEIEDEGEAA